MSREIPVGLTFDDVLLVPWRSEVHPNELDVSTRLTRNGIRLGLPIVSAAMDTVTEANMAIAMAQFGGVGVIHKNMSIERQAEEVDKVKRSESGMIVDPVTVHPEQSVREALDVMARYRISGLPVVDNQGQLEGILTNRDLRFCSEFERPIADFMTKEALVTAPVGTTLELAKSLLHKNRIEKLLIVDEAGNLKGLITVKDIKKAHDYPHACKDDLGRLRVAAGVGVTGDVLDRCAALIANQVDVLCLDSSHAHSRGVMEATGRIKKAFPETPLIVGNIATEQAARDLIALGADALKVGIGPGFDLYDEGRDRRRNAADHRGHGLRPRGKGRRRAHYRRWWHPLFGRYHQGTGCRGGRDHDRLVVCRGGGIARRADPLPGANLQGLPRNGLDRRHEEQRGLE